MLSGAENIDVTAGATPQVERTPEELAAALDAEQARANGAAALRDEAETTDPDAEALAFLVEHEFFGVEPHAPEAMVAIIQQMCVDYTINVCDPDELAMMGMTSEMIGAEFVTLCEDIVSTETVEEAELEQSEADVERAEAEAEAAEAEARAAEAEARAAEAAARAAEDEAAEVAETARAEEAIQGRLSEELTLAEIQSILGMTEQWSAVQGNERLAAVQATLSGIQTQLGNMQSVVPTDNPAEAAVLQQIVASTAVSWQAPSPSVRYAAIITQINAGQLSDDTRRRAIEALGISYNAAPEITTGSDVNEALEAGRGQERVQTGTETVEDPPGSGNFVEQPVYEYQTIPYTEDDPLRPRPNMEVFEEPGGERTVRIRVGDTLIETRVGADVRGEDMGKVANTMAVMQVAESMGLNSVLFQKGFNQLGGGAPVTIDWDDMNDAEQVMQTFLGGFTGFDGEVMTEEETERLRHNFQWLRRGEVSGDGGYGDHDSTRAIFDMQALGILDEAGNLVEAKLAAAGSFIQQNAFTSTSRFEQLQAYLETI